MRTLRSPAHPAAAVAIVAARAAAISLEEVLERAALQVRVDRKYLLSADEFVRLGESLGGDLDVLEIGGRRSFAYESRYFDTPGLQTYHEHAAGRPDRFKVRTRSYLDSGETMFEVKLATADGGTVKRRVAHPFAARGRLTPAARGHLQAALGLAGRSLPGALVETSVITYRRTTFVTADGSARITVDHDLLWSGGGGEVRALADRVLVEVKSATGDSRVDRALARLGLQARSVSKYCLGLALLHPELPSAPWDELLERHCDERRPAPATA
jgi:hypothetical protein